jgi:hypothetical protein
MRRKKKRLLYEKARSGLTGGCGRWGNEQKHGLALADLTSHLEVTLKFTMTAPSSTVPCLYRTKNRSCIYACITLGAQRQANAMSQMPPSLLPRVARTAVSIQRLRTFQGTST